MSHASSGLVRRHWMTATQRARYALLRWLSAGAVLAILSACGGGDATVDPGAPPSGPAAQGFRLLPQRLGMAVDADASVLALSSPGTVAWSMSDATVATVDAAGNVKALKKGTATISASSGTNVATATLTVYTMAGATPDPSGDALIAQALAQNTIDAEQALTYRVYALFGDERLPPQFVGAPSEGPDHVLLRQLSTTIDALSPATQTLLRPFLVPPIYAQSWFAQRLGPAPPAQASAAQQASAQQASALQAGTTKRTRFDTTVNCEQSRIPNAYTRVSTAHFNIYYVKLGDPAYDAGSDAAVALIASVIEEVYHADTALLARFPLADTGEACNGGDGAVDLYYGPFALFGLGAWTNSYPPGPGQNACANRPSYVMLNKLSKEFIGVERAPQEGRLLVKSILAHEFLHVLQFAMNRQASCTDTEWFDEATAQWAMDHVVPTIPAGVPGGYGAEPGLLNVSANYPKSGSVLAEYLYSGHMVSLEKPGAQPELNGYSDYLFFQYLARTQTPAKSSRSSTRWGADSTAWRRSAPWST